MSNTIASKVKAVMAESWSIPVEEVPDNAELNNFGKWDSLSHIQVLLALEQQMGLQLSADTIQSLDSLPKIVEHLSNIREQYGTRSNMHWEGERQ